MARRAAAPALSPLFPRVYVKSQRKRHAKLFSWHALAFQSKVCYNIRMSKSISKAMVEAEIAVSMAETRRVIQAGIVRLDGQKVSDGSVVLEKGLHTITIGKKTVEILA